MYQLFLENQSMEHALEQGRYEHDSHAKQHLDSPHLVTMLKALFQQTRHCIFVKFFGFLRLQVKLSHN